MTKSQKELVRQERQVNTYAHLVKAATVFSELARQSAAGSFYKYMGSLLMSALAFEAYLNHAGALCFEDWPERASWLVKLKLLAKKTGLSIDWNARPYSTLQPLFAFRNTIAHGRSEMIIPDPWVSSSDDAPKPLPKTEWEKQITDAHCELALSDIREAIRNLHQAAEHAGDPINDFGASSTVSSSLYDEQQTVAFTSGEVIAVPRSASDESEK